MAARPDLAQVPIFDRLSDGELRTIASAGTEVNLPANWSVMSEKTPADKAYIVLEGSLSVRKNKQEIATLGPGDVVGETAIVDHKLRNASVVSTQPVRMLHFTRAVIEQLCRDIPTFNEALSTAASSRGAEAGGSSQGG